MSKMSEIHMEIEELLAQGLSYSDIAERLNIPVSWVQDCANAAEYDDFTL